jgi:predicted PurR-regulated permease PerM
MSDASTTERRRSIPPHYQKLSLILLGLVALFHALSAVQGILVPVLFALLLAMLLNPVVNFLTRKRLPRILAIALCVILAMIALAGMSYFIVTQAAQFSETLPQLKQKLGVLFSDGQRWAQEKFNIQRTEVTQAVEKAKEEGMEKGGSYVGETLTAVGTVFAFFFLFPVFTFLILFYKQLLISFIYDLFPSGRQRSVGDVLGETKSVVQSYLVGLLMQTGIIATLNYIGLLIIGLEYAVLFAVLGAVLNLIPYIGMISATALPMIVAFATMEPVDALWVLALFAGVQFLDNNIIAPRVVASRVQLNALASILGVMAGGALWGIPGMFLSIPFIAILKVIFDRVPGLMPFGYLLGEQEDTEVRDTKTVAGAGTMAGSDR